MLTVSEVASKYGVSTAFLVLALGKIGVHRMEPDSPMSAATVARFEKAYGEKIRAARPRSSADADAHDLPLRTKRTGPKPHVMRVAHVKITGTRDANRNKVKALLDDPGTVHALDAVGTREGDPWGGNEAPGDVYFFDGVGGPYAACGRVQVRAVLGDRFDPEDTERDLCERCAELVADGKGFRESPWEREMRQEERWCRDYLRLSIEGRIVVEQCRLRGFHDGAHKTFAGATWKTGAKDYVPAPN